MKKIRRILLWALAVMFVYLVGGIVLSRWIFPPSKVDLSDYFRPGDKMLSKAEGFEQTVLAIKDGWLHTRLEVRPGAAGPPEHFHVGFTETFTVKSGTLSIMVNGEKRVLKAGETLSVPPMTPHRPFNETNEKVVVESENTKSIPVQFGYHLTQLYGFMDRYENGPGPLPTLMQLSVYGDEADSWIAGPPLVVQKAMRTVMAPTARLLGYRNNYEEYKPPRGK